MPSPGLDQLEHRGLEGREALGLAFPIFACQKGGSAGMKPSRLAQSWKAPNSSLVPRGEEGRWEVPPVLPCPRPSRSLPRHRQGEPWRIRRLVVFIFLCKGFIFFMKALYLRSMPSPPSCSYFSFFLGMPFILFHITLLANTQALTLVLLHIDAAKTWQKPGKEGKLPPMG